MKTAEQNTYRVEFNYALRNIEQLVEADSIMEAIEIVKSYYDGVKDKDIIGVHIYSKIIKKLTKTITIDV